MSRELLELPFDQHQRYAALALVADGIRALSGRPLRILDVGDWNGLAAQFCPEDVTICLDPDGGGVGRYVQADGRNLPFDDGAFDVVACLDALEHVAAAERPVIAAELRRVAARAVVVAVPCADGGAPTDEAALAAYVRDVLGGEQRQLSEHAAHGLPTADEARALLAAEGWRVADVPSGLIADWLPMMLAKHLLMGVSGSERLHRALDARHNARHGRVDPASPSYRHVVIATRSVDGDLADRLIQSLGRPRTEATAADLVAAATALLAAHASRAGAPLADAASLDGGGAALARTSTILDQRIRALLAESERLREELAAERRRAAALEATVRGYAGGRVMRLLALVARVRRRLARE